MNPGSGKESGFFLLLTLKRPSLLVPGNFLLPRRLAKPSRAVLSHPGSLFHRPGGWGAAPGGILTVPGEI